MLIVALGFGSARSPCRTAEARRAVAGVTVQAMVRRPKARELIAGPEPPPWPFNYERKLPEGNRFAIRDSVYPRRPNFPSDGGRDPHSMLIGMCFPS